MILLSERAQVLKEFAEFSFDSLKRATEGLTEKEAAWKPVEESNNINWILNHLARITNLSLPRIIKGDPEYVPEGWPENYRETHYSLKKMLDDIDMGKERVLEGLGKLTSEEFNADIPLWGGTRKRQFGLFAYLAEIINHKGQIVMLRGNIKRRREKDSQFLI